MTITTEEAELHRHQIEEVRLLSLAAERDALKADLLAARNGAVAASENAGRMMEERDAAWQEIEGLKALNRLDMDRSATALRSLKTERDALKAENARMKEVLERLARLGNEPHYGNSDGNMIARAELERLSRAGEKE